MLDTLRGRPRPLSEDYKERQNSIRERLENGGPVRIAKVVRDLTWHERSGHLTKVDTDLLARGREFLSAEIASVTDTRLVDAQHMIDDALMALSPTNL